MFNFEGCYLIYTLLLIGLIFSLFMVWEHNWNWAHMFWTPLIAEGLLIVVSMFNSTGTMNPANIPTGAQIYTQNSTNIYSLTTSELISGSFVLGSGNVNSTPSYIYYTQNGDNSYSINNVNANQCKIFFDNKVGAQLLTINAKWNQTPLDHKWMLDGDAFSHYELHLPIGSLVEQYNLNP